MRILVVIIALLAGIKVWTQDHAYRTAMSDALIAAYRERAVQTCHRLTAKPETVKAARSAPNPWTASHAATVVIGNASASVALWDIDNPLWNVRYRHPQLVLAGSGPLAAACSYDVVAGVARVSAH
jgi:hypothetical protein